MQTPIVSFSTDPVFSPTAATFTYAVRDGNDLVAAPIWISVDSANENLVINTAEVPAETGQHEFRLEGTVEGHEASELAPFTVTLYSYTAASSSNTPIYSLNSGSQDYTFDAWTLEPEGLGFTSTYTIEDSEGTSNPYTWLTIDSNTRTITIDTADSSLAAGQIPVFIRGELSDSMNSVATS